MFFIIWQLIVYLGEKQDTGAEFSVVPTGLLEGAFPNPGLRPGLLSDVPNGLSAEFCAAVRSG